MRIHTVKEGDTIFKIARSYAVAPAKIIENNALSSPDRLYPGQKLIILTPTRTYTVRGGDSLESIAWRFGVDTEELMRNNPSLMGGDKIYPGQILAIKYGETDFGNAVVNGYARRGVERKRLELFLPYLTYLTITSHKWENGELCHMFPFEEILKIAEERGVLPIMRIYISDSPKELSEKETKFIEDVICVCKGEGFSGFAISGAPLKERGFEAILRKLKKEAQESNLELHIELDGNDFKDTYTVFSEIADVSLLNYEREATRFYENFDLCEGVALRNYADRCEERKTLVDLFSPSFLDEKEVDFSELERLMQTRGIESVYNDGAKTASFSLKQYFGGKNKEAIAKFPTPENTKAKLELLGELGYMGVSFDIERSPVSSLVAFNSFFQREKAIKVRRERCSDQPSAPI